MTVEASARDADGARPGSRDAGHRTGQSSFLVAMSLVGTSLLGALQAFSLLVICGSDARTEAFLAAYVLYLPVAVMGSSLRATVSALVARSPVAQRANQADDIVSRCILFGAVVAGGMLVLTPVIVPLISGDLSADVRPTTFAALAFLLPAAFLHIVAAALSGALGAHGQFGYSAGAYVVTGAISLTVSIAMLASIGPLGAGVGVLTGTVVLAAAHVRRVREIGVVISLVPRRLLEREQWRLAGEVLTGAALGFALQANLAISIVVLDAQEGAITAYSYAYFMTAMILSFSSLPLALVTLPDLVGAVRRGGVRAVADHLIRCAPYAYAVVLPLVFGFLAFGEPTVTWAFDPFVAPGVADVVVDVGRALVVMALPATLFYLASAASLPAATPRGRLVAAALAIAVHATAVAIVAGDPQAIAWAHAAAMSISAAALMAQILRGGTLGALWRTLRAVLPVAVAAAPILLVGLLVGSSPSAAALAAAVLAGVSIYVAAIIRLAPVVAAPFIALLRRSALGA